VALRLARVKPTVRDLLVRDGVLEHLGEDHVHQSVADAVAVQTAQDGETERAQARPDAVRRNAGDDQ
jgi:hypothetical protein